MDYILSKEEILDKTTNKKNFFNIVDKNFHDEFSNETNYYQLLEVEYYRKYSSLCCVDVDV